MFVKDELVMDSEIEKQTAEALQERCNRLGKQNTALLKRLQEMEQEAEELEVRMESKGSRYILKFHFKRSRGGPDYSSAQHESVAVESVSFGNQIGETDDSDQ